MGLELVREMVLEFVLVPEFAHNAGTSNGTRISTNLDPGTGYQTGTRIITGTGNGTRIDTVLEFVLKLILILNGTWNGLEWNGMATGTRKGIRIGTFT